MVKAQVLASRPVVSDQGPGPSALQKRISTQTDVKQVKYYEEKEYSTCG